MCDEGDDEDDEEDDDDDDEDDDDDDEDDAEGPGDAGGQGDENRSIWFRFTSGHSFSRCPCLLHRRQNW